MIEPNLNPINKNVGIWINRLAQLTSRYFSGETEHFLRKVSDEEESPVFKQQRDTLIMTRTRFMAYLFALLTPLWIPVDMLVFPRTVWIRLALGRLVASAAFIGLVVLYCHHTATLRRSHLALAGLFFIPSIFFLFSHVVLLGVVMNSTGMIVASSYAFLPFVMVAGISIFPLTILECLAYVLPLLVISLLPMVMPHAYMIPNFKAIAVIWLLILVAGVGIMSSISQLQLMKNLFMRSTLDPLTGVFNRRNGMEMLALQLALARRHHFPLAVVFVDLDNFKQINDTWGHDIGDQVLVQVAQSWQDVLRESDTILRWGGEEFLLLLPHTDGKQAEAIVRNRCPAIKKPDDTIQTYSMGVAEWLVDKVTQGTALVKLADQRMYQAKIKGKNRIVGCDSITELNHKSTITF
ncbi:MAG: diguanylate cyclase [Pseudomonadota bacterium]|nr:diguanylate cyclase [Pseudomonadota bacterium]